MRYTFRATEGTLPLIGEIPDLPICWLEGRNAIGKSLAIRLLELATGTQPYDSLPMAWASLRQSLGRVSIRAVDEARQRTIAWELDPARWPSSPEPVGDWLGSITIDSSPASLSDVIGLLRAVRFGGDESLVTAIVRQIQTDRARVVRWTSRIEETAAPIDGLLHSLEEDLQRVDLGRFRDARQKLDTLAIRLPELRRQESDARQQYERLAKAVTLGGQLQQLTVDAPALDKEIAELKKRLQERSRERQILEKQREAVQQELLHETAQTKKAETARKTLGMRRRRLEVTQAQVSSAAEKLEVQLTASGVETALSEARRQLDLINDQIKSVEAAHEVRDLADRLRTSLSDAIARGYGGQIIAELEDARQLSVTELDQAITRRAEKVSVAPTTEKGAVLQGEQKRILDRIDSLRSLRELLERRQKLAAEVARAEKRLADLVAGLSGEAKHRDEQLRDQIASITANHQQLLVRHAQLVTRRSMLGDVKPKAVDRALKEATREAGVGEAELEEAFSRASEARQSVEGALRDAEREAESAASILGHFRAEVRHLVSVLNDDRYRALLPVLNGAMPQADQSDETNAARIAQLALATELARHSIDALRTRVVQGMRGALDDAIVWLERGGDTVRTPLLSGYFKHYGSLFGATLATDEVRQALFESASRIEFDLEQRLVTWYQSEGGVRARPLEAFSSGEKAFAYTLARLEGLGEAAGERLVALDEFGAFVDRDHLSQLFAVIDKRVIGRMASQIVIILPLRSEPNAESPDPSERQRANELRERGYFATPALGMP